MTAIDGWVTQTGEMGDEFREMGDEARQMGDEADYRGDTSGHLVNAEVDGSSLVAAFAPQWRPDEAQVRRSSLILPSSTGPRRTSQAAG